MVLFPIRVADQRDTLSRWHAEVYEHELKHEGTVVPEYSTPAMVRKS